ncbi:YecA family protein [soil metagenome]
MVQPMKLGGRERMDDGAALEGLFAHLPRTADWTIGFLTAVCTGPDPIAPAVWIPEIVPEGAFDADPTARAKVDLLARLYGAVAETLGTSPEIICPEADKPAQEAVDFCRGYVHGARMHESWRSDEVATNKLVPFEALAKENVEAERALLGSHVAELRAYWQSKRQVVNAAPKVGRNDPCPCGSGKKHKKCCLAKQGTA